MKHQLSRRLHKPLLVATMIGAVLILIVGCDESRRVAQVAERAAERQAAQNEEVVRLNREVAEGTRRLVEADAQARKELAAVHRELQDEQARIGAQRDALEKERKAMARERRTVSLWAPVVTGLASLLAITTLGAFCWSLLFGLRREDDSHEVLSELLVEELTSPRPSLLSGPAIDRSAAASELPPPEEPSEHKETDLESHRPNRDPAT